MRLIILSVFVALGLCNNAKAPTGTPVLGTSNAEGIHAIVQFLETYRNDISVYKPPTKEAILGSRMQDLDFRVHGGLTGIENQFLQKNHGGKGWCYYATVKTVPPMESSKAMGVAESFATTIRAQLIKDGFKEGEANPWKSIVFFKRIDDQQQIRIWVQYRHEIDGTFVTVTAASTAI